MTTVTLTSLIESNYPEGVTSVALAACLCYFKKIYITNSFMKLNILKTVTNLWQQ